MEVHEVTVSWQMCKQEMIPNYLATTIKATGVHGLTEVALNPEPLNQNSAVLLRVMSAFLSLDQVT